MKSRTLPRRRSTAGFTLLELIVAASILALIAVFSWRGLDALIRERDAIAASQATIDALQRAFARIERDALLAGDVQLDGAGTMRLVAGTSSVEGTPSATVEYRVVDGALVRSVVDDDRAPLVVVDGVASMTMEAWAPKPNGGSWVRTKGAAIEGPGPSPAAPGTAPPSQPNASANVPASAPVNVPTAAQANAQGQPPTTPGTSLPNGGAPGAPGSTVASVLPATGVRLTFTRADGAPVVRAFVVGGA